MSEIGKLLHITSRLIINLFLKYGTLHQRWQSNYHTNEFHYPKSSDQEVFIF